MLLYAELISAIILILFYLNYLLILFQMCISVHIFRCERIFISAHEWPTKIKGDNFQTFFSSRYSCWNRSISFWIFGTLRNHGFVNNFHGFSLWRVSGSLVGKTKSASALFGDSEFGMPTVIRLLKMENVVVKKYMNTYVTALKKVHIAYVRLFGIWRIHWSNVGNIGKTRLGSEDKDIHWKSNIRYFRSMSVLFE